MADGDPKIDLMWSAKAAAAVAAAIVASAAAWNIIGIATRGYVDGAVTTLRIELDAKITALRNGEADTRSRVIEGQLQQNASRRSALRAEKLRLQMVLQRTPPPSGPEMDLANQRLLQIEDEFQETEDERLRLTRDRDGR